MSTVTATSTCLSAESSTTLASCFAMKANGTFTDVTPGVGNRHRLLQVHPLRRLRRLRSGRRPGPVPHALGNAQGCGRARRYRTPVAKRHRRWRDPVYRRKPGGGHRAEHHRARAGRVLRRVGIRLHLFSHLRSHRRRPLPRPRDLGGLPHLDGLSQQRRWHLPKRHRSQRHRGSQRHGIRPRRTTTTTAISTGSSPPSGAGPTPPAISASSWATGSTTITMALFEDVTDAARRARRRLGLGGVFRRLRQRHRSRHLPYQRLDSALRARPFRHGRQPPVRGSGRRNLQRASSGGGHRGPSKGVTPAVMRGLRQRRRRGRLPGASPYRRSRHAVAATTLRGTNYLRVRPCWLVAQHPGGGRPHPGDGWRQGTAARDRHRQQLHVAEPTACSYSVWEGHPSVDTLGSGMARTAQTTTRTDVASGTTLVLEHPDR